MNKQAQIALMRKRKRTQNLHRNVAMKAKLEDAAKNQSQMKTKRLQQRNAAAENAKRMNDEGKPAVVGRCPLSALRDPL